MQSVFEQIDEGQFLHKKTGLPFTLMQGGEFEFGMSSEMEHRLLNRPEDFETEFVSYFVEEYQKWARPTCTITPEPFLIANFPLTASFLETNLGIPDQFSDNGAGYVPDSESIARFLADLGLRLPSETEWEFCHRKTISFEQFPGDYLLQMEPTDYLSGFGSYADICADVWQPTLEGIPSNGSPRLGDGPRTVRGGAANTFPWQGCGEWLGLLPFCRYPENSDLLMSVRPAAPIKA